ncbi:MAG TPA: hypothetical protein VKQ30_09735 [Ktedonobacterales bacterium]|nr:hypothetical protein [Ktedonobacterales bacterium]
MGSIGKWFEHIIGGMLQGCLVMAVLAAVVCLGGYTVARGHLPQGLPLAFILAFIAIAGLFGAAAALAWRLSHIAEIAHVAKEVSQHAMHSPEHGERV